MERQWFEGVQRTARVRGYDPVSEPDVEAALQELMREGGEEAARGGQWVGAAYPRRSAAADRADLYRRCRVAGVPYVRPEGVYAPWWIEHLISQV